MWASLQDPRGSAKERPAVILTPTGEIREGIPFVLMAITTSFPDPPPEHHVPLPWNPDPRRVRTRLAQRSAAVLTWLSAVSADQVVAVKGDVPAGLMRELQQRLQQLRDAQQSESGRHQEGTGGVTGGGESRAP